MTHPFVPKNQKPIEGLHWSDEVEQEHEELLSGVFDYLELDYIMAYALRICGENEIRKSIVKGKELNRAISMAKEKLGSHYSDAGIFICKPENPSNDEPDSSTSL